MRPVSAEGKTDDEREKAPAPRRDAGPHWAESVPRSAIRWSVVMFCAVVWVALAIWWSGLLS